MRIQLLAIAALSVAACAGPKTPAAALDGQDGKLDASLTDAAIPSDTADADGPTEAYPAVAATLPVQLTACDTTFAFQHMPWTARPASEATCYQSGGKNIWPDAVRPACPACRGNGATRASAVARDRRRTG